MKSGQALMGSEEDRLVEEEMQGRVGFEEMLADLAWDSSWREERKRLTAFSLLWIDASQ